MIDTNSAVIKIDTCEVCLSKLVGPELDFGEQPLCDDLQTTSQESLSVKKYHQNSNHDGKRM